MGGVVSGRAFPPGAHAVCAQQSPRPPASRSPGWPRSLSRRGCGGSQHRAGRAAPSQLGSLWPFRAAPEPHRGAAEWSRARLETRGSSCGSSRGGRPPLGGGGAPSECELARRRHQGTVGGAVALADERGFPFLLPLSSGGSRGLYSLSVHQVQGGSDVRFGHGQREASRDAGRGARGPRGPPTLWWPRTPSATPRGARRVTRPFRHRGAFRWSLSPPLRRLSLGGTVPVSRREGTPPTPLSVRSARVGRRVRGGLRIVPAARHRQLIHPQDVRRRDAG